MKKLSRLFLFSLLAISLLLSACGSGEIILPPGSPETIANGGNPVFIPPAKCGTTPSTGGLVFCDPGLADGTQLAGLDAALIGSMATPWPGDEEVAAVVWAGNKVVKLYLYLTAAYLANNAIEYTVHEVVSGQIVEERLFVEAHNPLHDVTHPDNLPKVKAMVATYTTWVATGGPRQPQTNGNFQCRVLKEAGQIISYLLWQKDGGQLLIWGDGFWRTFYTKKPLLRLNNPPEDHPNGIMETFGCDQFPTFPPLPS